MLAFKGYTLSKVIINDQITKRGVVNVDIIKDGRLIGTAPTFNQARMFINKMIKQKVPTVSQIVW